MSKGLFGTICVALLLVTGTVQAQAIPTDEDGFTRYVALRLGERVRTSVTVKSSLTLVVGSFQANLDRIFRACGGNRQQCPGVVDDYINGVVNTMAQITAPISRDAVRVVVRTDEYLAATEASLPRGSPRIPRRLLVDGLLLIPALDLPESLRFISEDDVATLESSIDEVFELGLKNLDGTEALVKSARPLAHGQIGQLPGDVYITNLLARPKLWGSLAAAQHGTLIVAAPTTDGIVYSGEATPEALDAFRSYVETVAARAPNPLSPMLLRWTIAGWERVP